MISDEGFSSLSASGHQAIKKQIIFMKPILNLLFVGILLSIYSCRSQKEFTYFQDIKTDQHIPGVSNVVQEYKIKTYDNLYVSIKTLNPEVNTILDATQSANNYGGTDQMYGSIVSQYINGYQVDSLGTITLPIIGTVEVVGLTLKQIQNKIQKESLKFLKEPTIKVKLLSFKVNIAGEVKNPGIYYSHNERLSILEAISMASGVTDNAKLKNVLVVRQTPKGSDSFILNLTRKNLMASNAYYLQPNDMVYIKSGNNKRVDLNNTTYSLFLSTVSTILSTITTILVISKL